jgi:hypothetical protein
MATHDLLIPQHDGLAPVEADDAAWIIIRVRPVAKRAATNGMFGPTSGGIAPRASALPRSPSRTLVFPFRRKGGA